MLKNIFKLLLFLLIMGVCILIVFIETLKVEESENINDTINNTKEIANNITAKNIIEYIENAYSMAYIKRSSYPTLLQVKENFSLNKITWENDYIIEAEGFNCTVKVVNNNLKVKCLEYETNDNLKLSN